VRRVIVESPFAGNWWQRLLNRRYARAALRDCLARGEAPIASHLLYTQILNDSDPGDRALGVAAGLAWLDIADASVVYVDRGISGGMQKGMAAAEAAGVPVEKRSLQKRKPYD
jgi:hypothetical protein